MRTKLITTLFGLSLITGCATKRETGAVAGAAGGAAVGGLVGGKTGVIVGGVLGGILGYSAGRAMEEEDRRRALYALEQNRAVQWENPRTGYHYEVVPTQTVYQQGQECREFRMLAQVDGRPDEVNGTACRQPNGQWEVVGV